MRARRALIFRHLGHTTRGGIASRPRWMLRHRHPGARRGTTWCGSGSFSLCEPRRQGEYRNRRSVHATARRWSPARAHRLGRSVR